MNSVQFPLALNKEYVSFEALKTACREAAILGNFEYATVKSDKPQATLYDQMQGQSVPLTPPCFPYSRFYYGLYPFLRQ